MNKQKMIEQALQLEPAGRFELVEKILHSLDQPDPVIDAAWQHEARRRLADYRAGKAQSVPAEEVFGPL